MMRASVVFLVLLSATGLFAVTDDEIDRLLDEAEELFRPPVSPRVVSTSHRLYKKGVHPVALRHGQQAAAFAHASSTLVAKYGLSRSEANERLAARSTPRPGFDPNAICNRALTCNNTAVYRTIDGSCNNLNNPDWGMAVVPFDRLIGPSYGDGVGSLRQNSPNNVQLLSPRVISLIVHPDFNVLHALISHILVIFGQFLDHDITSTPEFQNFQCCANTNLPQCMPIQVPSNDEWYGQFGISCLDVGRSIPSCAPGPTGMREQINQVSAFIDCSHIYGSSAAEQAALRGANGLLLTDTNTQLLPKDPQARNCGNNTAGIVCFKAGDDRVNENPGLTSMHTLWMREHNRIVQALLQALPNLSAEALFQEARRIVIAQFQNIVYNEYLPVVLGTTTMGNFGLTLPAPGSFSSYDIGQRPHIFNSFATAAYRFGHTLIQNLFSLAGAGSLALETNFQNPQIIYQSVANIDRLLLGATTQPAQNYENFVAQAVTRHLFQPPSLPFGSDLASVNIQRGRDHGLPPYVAFRNFCGLSIPQSHDDLLTLGIVTNVSTINRFKDAFFVVNDIDLWTGGISEVPMSGAVVGPTFACIIALQFERLKNGDRYFFTHGGQVGSFTSAQLSMLRARTLASVMCDNEQPIVTDGPSNSFLLGQTRIACASQPKLNLTGWTTAGTVAGR